MVSVKGKDRANAYKKNVSICIYICRFPTEFNHLCVITFGAVDNLHLLYAPPPKAD
ncbi:hypothetical protein Echvi_2743 [Echinicola vietnamensis DSM 17526]|uniref:Uncharacterized protein n=1 Tax=Echinicola vietnamensis (strain DSM 17526 / LMG 23754 / KMM 6221) TaxID=926556 RepID=L0G102_ECHVK|nr:hypothetical protein Echvi_2743 [Echinicola vietnamensis DSM 17526]